jgi:hypothetical protein
LVTRPPVAHVRIQTSGTDSQNRVETATRARAEMRLVIGGPRLQITITATITPAAAADDGSEAKEAPGELGTVGIDRV